MAKFTDCFAKKRNLFWMRFRITVQSKFQVLNLVPVNALESVLVSAILALNSNLKTQNIQQRLGQDSKMPGIRLGESTLALLVILKFYFYILNLGSELNSPSLVRRRLKTFPNNQHTFGEHTSHKKTYKKSKPFRFRIKNPCNKQMLKLCLCEFAL